jgi:DNA-binding XRE family transcriptional regulator
MGLGEAIRLRRTELGMSQAALAKAAGVDTWQIRQCEADEQQPLFTAAVAIAAALRVPLAEMAGLSAEPAAGSAQALPRVRHGRLLLRSWSSCPTTISRGWLKGPRPGADLDLDLDREGTQKRARAGQAHHARDSCAALLVWLHCAARSIPVTGLVPRVPMVVVAQILYRLVVGSSDATTVCANVWCAPCP